jgi:hypothetical protein
MQKTFKMIKDIPESKMFCFGGIGATPDDYTRNLSFPRAVQPSSLEPGPTTPSTPRSSTRPSPPPEPS